MIRFRHDPCCNKSLELKFKPGRSGREFSFEDALTAIAPLPEKEENATLGSPRKEFVIEISLFAVGLRTQISLNGAVNIYKRLWCVKKNLALDTWECGAFPMGGPLRI
jgi:hypothetical protein